MAKSRLALRNKLIRTINEDWAEKFGAKAHGLPPPIPGREVDSEFHWRFVQGIARNGRAIVIYPLLARFEKIPFRICHYMMEFEKRGAIVGCAEGLGDCYCIVADNPAEYRRFKKTYSHRKWFEYYSKGKVNDRTD